MNEHPRRAGDVPADSVKGVLKQGMLDARQALFDGKGIHVAHAMLLHTVSDELIRMECVSAFHLGKGNDE